MLTAGLSVCHSSKGLWPAVPSTGLLEKALCAGATACIRSIACSVLQQCCTAIAPDAEALRREACADAAELSADQLLQANDPLRHALKWHPALAVDRADAGGGRGLFAHSPLRQGQVRLCNMHCSPMHTAHDRGFIYWLAGGAGRGGAAVQPQHAQPEQGRVPSRGAPRASAHWLLTSGSSAGLLPLLAAFAGAQHSRDPTLLLLDLQTQGSRILSAGARSTSPAPVTCVAPRQHVCCLQAMELPNFLSLLSLCEEHDEALPLMTARIACTMVHRCSRTGRPLAWLGALCMQFLLSGPASHECCAAQECHCQRHTCQ